MPSRAKKYGDQVPVSRPRANELDRKDLEPNVSAGDHGPRGVRSGLFGKRGGSLASPYGSKACTRLVLALSVFTGCGPADRERPRDATLAGQTVLREEQGVTVGARFERWRLVWQEPPKPECASTDKSAAFDCTCSGYRYGEKGHLALVRLGNGQVDDRLEL